MDALTRWSFILCGAMAPFLVWDIWRTRRRAREAVGPAAEFGCEAFGAKPAKLPPPLAS